MQPPRIRTILTLAIASASLCNGAIDQSFTFEPRGVLPNVVSPTLTAATAAALIDQTLGPPIRMSKDFYCVIHMLRWKENSTDVEQQNWYVYHNGRGWSETQFNAGRIYGSHNVAVLFVHVNARGVQKTLIPDAALGGVARERLNAVPTGLELTANAAGFDLKSADDKGLTVLDAWVVHTDHFRVRYKAEISGKLPHAISDLANLVFPSAQARTATGVTTIPVAIWGGGVMHVEPVPSDINVTGARVPAPSPLVAANPAELGKKTIDNEGRYWWDISAGVPLKGIKELNFDSASQTVAPREVSRTSLLAFFNVFPMKIDTKADRQGIVPVLLVGMGIAERPLDRIVFAGGLGINKVQFFAGTAYTNKSFPGETPGSVITARRTNFIFGLNIPLRQAVSYLKKSK